MRMNGMEKDKEFKHWCGCITRKYKDGVKLIKICEEHQLNGNFAWIATLHPNDEEIERRN